MGTAAAPDDAADLSRRHPCKNGRAASIPRSCNATEVSALLAYAEDDAGGLMSTRFARVRPQMTVDEAISYLRRQAGQVETIYYAYALTRNSIFWEL